MLRSARRAPVLRAEVRRERSAGTHHFETAARLVLTACGVKGVAPTWRSARQPAPVNVTTARQSATLRRGARRTRSSDAPGLPENGVRAPLCAHALRNQHRMDAAHMARARGARHVAFVAGATPEGAQDFAKSSRRAPLGQMSRRGAPAGAAQCRVVSVECGVESTILDTRRCRFDSVESTMLDTSSTRHAAPRRLDTRPCRVNTVSSRQRRVGTAVFPDVLPPPCSMLLHRLILIT